MTAGLASNTKKAIEYIVRRIEDKTSVKVATSNAIKAGIFSADFDNFPAAWVRRGAETRYAHETSRGVFAQMDILVAVAVKSLDAPEDAMEEIIQEIENAVLSDADQNSSVTDTQLRSISEPTYFFEAGLGEAVMTFQIITEYTEANR